MKVELELTEEEWDCVYDLINGHVDNIQHDEDEDTRKEYHLLDKVLDKMDVFFKTL